MGGHLPHTPYLLALKLAAGSTRALVRSHQTAAWEPEWRGGDITGRAVSGRMRFEYRNTAPKRRVGSRGRRPPSSKCGVGTWVTRPARPDPGCSATPSLGPPASHFSRRSRRISSRRSAFEDGSSGDDSHSGEEKVKVFHVAIVSIGALDCVVGGRVSRGPLPALRERCRPPLE